MTDTATAPIAGKTATKTAPQGQPIWYELMTPDPAAVAPFYRAVLGWEIPAEGHPMPNGSEYREITRDDGGNAGGVLKLTPQMAGGGAKPGWIAYFHVADVDVSVAKAQNLGASVHMPPMTMDGVGRMAMIADPQGAPLYVMDPTPPPDRPDAQSDVFDPAKAGHCRWNELNTIDGPGALDFYTALFGWTKGMAMPMGEAGDYQFIEGGGVAIGAINPVPEPPSFWLPVFGVTDIAAARAAVEANGGTITTDLQEVPGGEFALNADDPSGAAVAFLGPKRGE
jgi:predicted enzyme related to lactoylglutathione lyase